MDIAMDIRTMKRIAELRGEKELADLLDGAETLSRPFTGEKKESGYPFKGLVIASDRGYRTALRGAL